MTDHTTDTDARRNRQAIILGIDSPIGLTMIRELARHDVRVIGLARSKAGIGLYSRYLHEGHIRERDEDALIAAMRSGRVKGAALDVFLNEPEPRQDLLQLEDMSLSPHIGAATSEAQGRVGEELVDRIVSWRSSVEV